MAKPWEENYQEPQEQGPWTEYQESPEPQAPSIVQETHPEVGLGTRTLLKWLAQSPEAQAGYLKKKGFESEVIDGQVAVKKPGEKQWRALDPSTMEFADVSDIAADIGMGVASGAATAAGGLAGATLGGGIGAIPGAAAAGGATSAGLEALRQKLGAYYGIPQEVSAEDVKAAGIVGAVAPAVFGTGAKAAAGTLKQQLAQRGLLQRGYEGTKKAFPKIGEYFTGVPAKATQTYATRKKAVEALAEEGATGEAAASALEKLKSGLAQAKVGIGQKLEAEIDQTGKTINLGKIKKPIDDYIQELETSPIAKNPITQQKISEFKTARDQVFKTAAEGGDLIDLPPEISAKHAFEIQDLVKDLADLKVSKTGLESRFGQSMSSQEKGFSEAARRSYTAINEELGTATEGASQQLKDQYRAYSKLQKQLSTRFKTPEQTEKTLSNLFTPANRTTLDALREASEMTSGAADILPEAELLQASRFYNQPAWQELSGQGTTGTSRRLGLGGLGAYAGYKVGGVPGIAMGAAMGGAIGSPAAMKRVYIPLAKGAARAVETPAKYIDPYVVPGGMSIWNLMQGEQ